MFPESDICHEYMFATIYHRHFAASCFATQVVSSVATVANTKQLTDYPFVMENPERKPAGKLAQLRV